MAASNSYSVTVTAKCGQDLIFSLVKRIDALVSLDAVKIGAGPDGQWYTVDLNEKLSVMSDLSLRHILLMQ